MKPIKQNSALLAIIACLLWSSAFVGIKIGLPYTTPIHFAGIRFIIASLIILPFCRSFRYDLSLLYRGRKKVLLISLFQTFGLYACFYAGLSRLPAAVTAIIIGASPLFVAIIASVYLKESLVKKKLISLIFGFCGIIFLASARFYDVDGSGLSLVGILFLVLANLFGSVGNILIATNRIGVSPLSLNAVQLFIGGLSLLILSFYLEGFEFSIKPKEYYFSLAWLSFLSAAAFSLWFIILQRPSVKVSEINIWKFIIPVFGAVLSWIILPDEHPTTHTISGMVLVGLALLIMNWPKNFLRLKGKL